MKDTIQELCEVFKKQGIVIEIDSASLEIERGVVDTREHVTRKPIHFRCVALTETTEEDIKNCSIAVYLYL